MTDGGDGEPRGERGRNGRGRRGLWAVGIASAGLAAGLLIGQVLPLRTRCEISDLSAHPDVGLTAGEPDAGIRVAFTLANRGRAGRIEVVARVSSSEGEWTRQQGLEFQAGEVRHLSFFFQEPTLNATNVEYGAHCEP